MTNDNNRIITRQLLVPFALVTLLFFFWGVANNMNDTLLAAFRRIMSMSDLQTSLVQVAFYGAYFCMAIPAALLINKYSYKAGVLVGLFAYALGTMLFYPAGLSGDYAFFLLAIYVMATGCAVLETAANPYILAMGPRESATRRLNIAQTLNSLGAFAGILLSRSFILSELKDADAAERGNMSAQALHQLQQHELGAISGTYMLIGGLLLVVFAVIALMRMPKFGAEAAATPQGVLRRLWRIKRYRKGVFALFFYVGAQTCVWSFTIRLVMQLSGCAEAQASDVFLYAIVAFAVCRFIFAWLMKYFRPERLLTVAVIGALAGTLMVMFCPDAAVAIPALVGISGCMSLMFPTIYGMALESVDPADAKIGASGLIMAILGGAAITPLQALMSDWTGNISISFLVPYFCFAMINIYATSYGKSAS